MDLALGYLQAKHAVVEAGFAEEIYWQSACTLDEVTDNAFFREAAWVILSTGMRESVVRSLFGRLTPVFHEWNLIEVIGDPDVYANALAVYRHSGKIRAILIAAEVGADLGEEEIRRQLRDDPSEILGKLPFIGPVAGRHLRKNLGLSVAKPDRHLVRIASSVGRRDADCLCREISDWLDEPIPVVDIVLWRWATLHQKACRQRACIGAPHGL